MEIQEKYEITKYLAYYDIYRNGYYGKYQQRRFANYVSPVTVTVERQYKDKTYEQYIDSKVIITNPLLAFHPRTIRMKKKAEKSVHDNYQIIFDHLIKKGFKEETIIEDAKEYYFKVNNNLICAYPNGEVIFEGVLYSKLYNNIDFKPFVDYATFVLSYLSSLRIYNTVLSDEAKKWVDRSRHTPNASMEDKMLASITYMMRKFNRDNSHFMIKYSCGNTLDELTKLMNWLVDEFVDFDRFEAVAAKHEDLYVQVLQSSLLDLIKSDNKMFEYAWKGEKIDYVEFFNIITPPRWMSFAKLGVENNITPRVFAKAMFDVLFVKQQAVLLPDFYQWETNIINQAKKIDNEPTDKQLEDKAKFEDHLKTLREFAETKVLDILEEEEQVSKTINKEVGEEIIEIPDEVLEEPAEVSIKLNSNDAKMKGFIEMLKDMEIDPDSVTEIIVKVN